MSAIAWRAPPPGASASSVEGATTVTSTRCWRMAVGIASGAAGYRACPRFCRADAHLPTTMPMPWKRCWRRGSEIACVIVEPVAGNMGVVPPRPGFLSGCVGSPPPRGTASLRRGDHRLPRGHGGAQVGVLPDLTTLARSSTAAFAGSLQQASRPDGADGAHRAGLSSGHAPGNGGGGGRFGDAEAAAARATWSWRRGGRCRRLEDAARQAPATVNRVGSMLTSFSPGKPSPTTPGQAGRHAATRRSSAVVARGVLALSV